MKRILYILFLLHISLQAFAQHKAYVGTYGGLQDNTCNQAKPTNDGGYVLIGTTNSSGCGNTDMYVIKTDSIGRKMWSKSYGGELNEEGFSIEQTFDHGYVLLGFTNSFGNGGYDVYLVRTDSNGGFLWQRTYGGADWDFGYSIRQLADSGFVIVGQTYSFGQGNGDVYIIRTDKFGDTLWTKTVGGTGYDVANSVSVFRDSLYYIAGSTTSFGLGDTDMYLVKINNNGLVEKDTTLGSTHVDKASSIRFTKNNNLLIYGSSDTVNPGYFAEIMIRLDSNFHYAWSPNWQIYACSKTSIGNDAIEVPNGNLVTMATSNCNGAGGYNMHVQITQPGGWWITGPDFGGIYDEQGMSIALGKNGSFLFAGTSDSPGYTNGLFNVFTVCADTIQSNSLYTFVYNSYKDTTTCYLGVPSAAIVTPGVKLFPDPVVTTATVLVQGTIGEKYSINIFNELGQMMMTTPLSLSGHGQSMCHIMKNGLAPGTYMYVIVNREGDKVATGKFIVE